MALSMQKDVVASVTPRPAFAMTVGGWDQQKKASGRGQQEPYQMETIHVPVQRRSGAVRQEVF